MQRKHRISYHKRDMDIDLYEYLKTDACPVCNDGMWVESLEDEETYVDDEEHVMTSFGPRFIPYKDYICGSCGAQFRVYTGPISIRLLKDSDATVEDDNGGRLA